MTTETENRYLPPTPLACSEVQATPFGTRQDPWHWLRDESRSDAQVRAHLCAEARTTARWFEPLSGELLCLEAEHAALVPDEDSDLPVLLRGYWYETRYEKGAEHPLYVRRKVHGQEEEILFDAAAAAIHCPAYSLGDRKSTRLNSSH